VRITRCRVCEGRDLRLLLDLGCTALANAFLRREDLGRPETTFPLRLVLCGDCGLVQIDEDVPPDVLFKHYVYVTGTSNLVRLHAAWLAGHCARLCPLGRGDLVVEAASNDGTLLRAFRRFGVRTVGIEPAENLAEQANQEGIETLARYFDETTADDVRAGHGPARLVLARHVLAHAADLHGFVRGLEKVLGPDGLAVIEVPHLLPFYENVAYDTIYHEHRCYFSVRVLKGLLERGGLQVVDVREVSLHGGSVVVTAQRTGGRRRATSRVRRVLEREERAALHQAEPWQAFARAVAASKEELLAELDRLRAAGRSLAGYGAPAKGMTLLAYCGIGPDRLPYLVDRSPLKQHHWTPGHHVPILPSEQLLEDQPDVVLLLAWNFAAEIVRQQAVYRERGGRFLLPLPQPQYWHAGLAQGREAASRVRRVMRRP
jgi:novobiocin biosynthesis protein NovU/D-mycarose 3-C-methyltransferase